MWSSINQLFEQKSVFSVDPWKFNNSNICFVLWKTVCLISHLKATDVFEAIVGVFFVISCWYERISSPEDSASVIICSTIPCCWVRWSAVVHKTFLELHSKTVSEHWPWTTEVDVDFVLKLKKMALHSSSDVIQVSGSPKIPNWFVKTSALSTHSQACAPTSDVVLTNTFCSAATVKILALKREHITSFQISLGSRRLR